MPGAQIERRLDTKVFEIYGCTEAGSLASRRTVDSECWTLYPEMKLAQSEGVLSVSGPQLPRPVVLSDSVEIAGEAKFRLLGRRGDLVNIAGKRGSLNDITTKILAIDGVEDVIVMQPSADKVNSRLAALVVAPSLTAMSVKRALRAQLDPVFIPRPLRFVDSLPRNETGKLPKAALNELLQRVGLERV